MALGTEVERADFTGRVSHQNRPRDQYSASGAPATVGTPASVDMNARLTPRQRSRPGRVRPPPWVKMLASRAGASQPPGAIVLRLLPLRWLPDRVAQSGPRCVEIHTLSLPATGRTCSRSCLLPAALAHRLGTHRSAAQGDLPAGAPRVGRKSDRQHVWATQEINRVTEVPPRSSCHPQPPGVQ